MTTVSIITVNYNQTQVTAELLESIRQCGFTDLEVIVVDNASEENPADVLQKDFPEVRFLRSEQNLGFAGGNNLGIKASSGKYLFFLNNDTELSKGTLESLLGLFETMPTLGIVSPMLCYYGTKGEKDLIQYAGSTKIHPITGRNRTIGEGEEDKRQFPQPEPTAYVHGAAMLVSRKVIEKVGLMEPGFFLYYEELDWCARIRKAGYAVFVHPSVKVYHKESISVGKMSPLKTYYHNRNRILFMQRNKKAWEFVLFSVYMLSIALPKHLLVFLIQGEWEHIHALWKGVWWNYGWKKRISIVETNEVQLVNSGSN